MSTTYTGWPVIPPGDSRLTIIAPVPGRRFTVRDGAVAVVLAWLIARFDAEVEPITEGPVLDDWGHAYRKVRGGSSWSSHASGTAVDLNADDHPFGTRAERNFTPAQIAAIRRILADAEVDGRPVLRWLDTNDPMHFEVNYVSRGGSPDAVAVLAARIQAGGAPAPVVPAPAPVELVPLEPRAIEWANPPADLTRIVQEIVGAKVDGERGDETRRLTKAHQRRLGVQNPDTLFGPRHALAYLLSVGNLYRAKPNSDMPAGAVKLLQWIGQVTPDADFGEGTESAVKRMQKWAGLYPDGNAGEDTKRKIVR